MSGFISIRPTAVVLRARMRQAQSMGVPVVLQSNPNLIGRWRRHGPNVGGSVVIKPDLT